MSTVPARVQSTAAAVELARELDTSIRALARQAHLVLDALYALVEAAQANEIHVALGFPSWTAYIADALDGQWKLEKDKRGEVVRFLRSQGMSVRAIVKTTGVGHGTVQREVSGVPLVQLITGMDGKSYTPDRTGVTSVTPGQTITITIPATIDGLRDRLEEIAEEERQLSLAEHEMELAEIEAMPPGTSKVAREFIARMVYVAEFARKAIVEEGMSVEKFAKQAGATTEMVEVGLHADGVRTATASCPKHGEWIITDPPIKGGTCTCKPDPGTEWRGSRVES